MIAVNRYCIPLHYIISDEKKTDMPKKEGVRKLFDNIASDYDRLNHILSLNIDKGWRRKAVRQIADENRAMKVLDVACGTAASCLMFFVPYTLPAPLLFYLF